MTRRRPEYMRQLLQRGLGVLSALLLGCAADPLRQDVQRTEFHVRVHQLSSAEVQNLCLRLGVQKQQNESVLGCSEMHMGTLSMYVTPPSHQRDEAAFAVIGHELWHGVAGRFHP